MTLKERVKVLENKVSELEDRINRLIFGHNPKDISPYDLSKSRTIKNVQRKFRTDVH